MQPINTLGIINNLPISICRIVFSNAGISQNGAREFVERRDFPPFLVGHMGVEFGFEPGEHLNEPERVDAPFDDERLVVADVRVIVFSRSCAMMARAIALTSSAVAIFKLLLNLPSFNIAGGGARQCMAEPHDAPDARARRIGGHGFFQRCHNLGIG